MERTVIGLDPGEVITLLRAALDDDEEEALGCLKQIVIPKLEATQRQIHCRPVFELEACKKDLESPCKQPNR